MNLLFHRVYLKNDQEFDDIIKKEEFFEKKDQFETEQTFRETKDFSSRRPQDSLDFYMKKFINESQPNIKKNNPIVSNVTVTPRPILYEKIPGKSKSILKRNINHHDGDTDDTDSHTTESDNNEVLNISDDDRMKNLKQGKLSKGDRLSCVNHTEISYPPFRKNFYVKPMKTSSAEYSNAVSELSRHLNNLKVIGHSVPQPIMTWNQAGLDSRILAALKKDGLSKPMAIQALSLPVIMSGRDCIGIAKTGSGKTLAFILPLLQHVKDQPSPESGEGPIAIIVLPTREIVTQIGRNAKRLAKLVNLNVTCVYGGSALSAQISELKKGPEIVTCTPGRIIDLLVMSCRKITNLRRVTFLVIDEADRMFDMGFEPQIQKIILNIRPDRQSVLFSATFPRAVRLLALSIVCDPVEILEVSQSEVNSDITQNVELRPTHGTERFLRLLQILGEWYGKSKILIFVSSQIRCDEIFRSLLKCSYPCLSLHGAKDQSERMSTLTDFEKGISDILVSTSVVARGLDFKDLDLVINYDAPNHFEDYVHRVGRTGRAGRKGTSITFLDPETEGKHAPDLVRAIKEAGQVVPEDLNHLANNFSKKNTKRFTTHHLTGYGGCGFKFDKAEEHSFIAKKKAQFLTLKCDQTTTPHNPESEQFFQGESASDEYTSSLSSSTDPIGTIPNIKTPMVDYIPPSMAISSLETCNTLRHNMSLTEPSMDMKASKLSLVKETSLSNLASTLASDLARRLTPTAKHPTMQIYGPQRNISNKQQFKLMPENTIHQTEIEINDLPQINRWKATHKDTLREIADVSGVTAIVRGKYFMPEEPVPESERKLHILLMGPTASSIYIAKTNLLQVLEKQTEKALRKEFK